jgi:hypothetical protein
VKTDKDSAAVKAFQDPAAASAGTTTAGAGAEAMAVEGVDGAAEVELDGDLEDMLGDDLGRYLLSEEEQQKRYAPAVMCCVVCGDVCRSVVGFGATCELVVGR